MTLPGRPAAMFALLTIVACFLAACSGGTVARGPDDPTGDRGNGETTTARLDPDDPLVQETGMYAKDQGVSFEDLKGLRGALETNEHDTFAGLWIQHEPEYRVVALFTRDGEETIRPYIEGKPWAYTVEVRNGADATLAELEKVRKEVLRIVRDLVIISKIHINQQENRVDLDVLDRGKFDAALREADARLPERVVVFEDPTFPQPK